MNSISIFIFSTLFVLIKTDCGRPVNPVLFGWRIINGETAQRGAWPWQVSLKSKGKHFCGAIIIDEYWLISAAHCFAKTEHRPEDIQVVVGEHDQFTVDPHEETYSIDKIFQHKEYKGHLIENEEENDIVLIKIKDPIQFNSHVHKICLPTESVMEKGFEGMECWITGWGLTQGTSDERYLQQLITTVVPTDTCEEHWGDLLKPGMICVGSTEGFRQGSCRGDSGGPLSCQIGNTFYLAGTTSFGTSNCGVMYSIYARITTYLDWIRKIMAEN